MFPSAAFAIIVVDNQCPRLLSSLEALGYTGNGIRAGLRRIMVVVEGDVHFTALIVDRLQDPY